MILMATVKDYKKYESVSPGGSDSDVAVTAVNTPSKSAFTAVNTPSKNTPLDVAQLAESSQRLTITPVSRRNTDTSKPIFTRSPSFSSR